MKPVAWGWLKRGKFYDAIGLEEHARAEGSYKTPLYTAPQTKPLSDEEITELAEKYLAGFSQYGCCNTNVEGEIEFARAIEERHGIK